MLLHVLVFAPFLAALLVAVASANGRSSRLPILLSAGILAASVALLIAGDTETSPIDWFKLPGSDATVKYWLGTFTVNAWMVFLSCLLTLVALISARSSFSSEYRNFAVGMLALLGTLNGSFLALDAVLFFFFFEAMVIPAAVLIAAYGGENRRSAAMNFAIYTLIGSAPMCIALWYMVAASGSTTASGLFAYLQTLSPESVLMLSASFMLAFMVKTPIFPFHGWQAMTYAEAPAPLSAILTGAMSKVGVYGMLVWVLSLFPASPKFEIAMLMLGLVTAIYGALMALRATDIKKLLAFSSMGHLGLAVAAVFTFSPRMMAAVLVLLVGHGLTAGGLFFLSGTVERLSGTRELAKIGGLASTHPVFAFLFGAIGIAALSVPGTAGFIGEFLALLSLWDVGPFPALCGGLCLILSAAYTLRLIQGVLFGKPVSRVEGAKPLSVLEGSALALLFVLTLVFGVRPALVYEFRVQSDSETEASSGYESGLMSDAQSSEVVDDGEYLTEEEIDEFLRQIMTEEEIAEMKKKIAEDSLAKVDAAPETKPAEAGAETAEVAEAPAAAAPPEKPASSPPPNPEPEASSATAEASNE